MRIYKHFFVLAVLPFITYGCSLFGGKNKNNENEQYEYPVLHPIKKDTVLVNDFVADIEAEQNVEIRSRISGFLDSIYVKEGDDVKKGQILFKINDNEYKTSLARAKATLASAKAEFSSLEVERNRVSNLVSKNILSKSELDVANANLDAAKARVEEAEAVKEFAEIQLNYTKIRAPFNGTIDRLPLKLGSLVSEGLLLTTISDIDNVYAYFHVAETQYLNILEIQRNENTNKVKLFLSDGTEYPIEGTLFVAESEINESTGSIAFKAFFPNSDRILKHGASGKLKVRRPIKDATLIPQKSVFEIQDKNFVYIITPENKAYAKEIKISSRIAPFYVVDEGLTPDDVILYEGIQSVREGDLISPNMISESQISSY